MSIYDRLLKNKRLMSKFDDIADEMIDNLFYVNDEGEINIKRNEVSFYPSDWDQFPDRTGLHIDDKIIELKDIRLNLNNILPHIIDVMEKEWQFPLEDAFLFTYKNFPQRLYHKYFSKNDSTEDTPTDPHVGSGLIESKYNDKIINHIKNDPLEKRLDLKEIYSLSADEYFELLEYEVNLINSLQGEIFDTSDPKWSGTGNYEFEFEIDKAHITDRTHPEDEHILFKGDIIDIDVDVDVHGSVFLESSMIDNPGRDWSIGEATNDKSIGYIVISEIRDIVYTIIEQRLPLLKNLGTLNVCNVEEDWVTRLSNEDKGNINEGVYNTGDNKDFLEYVYNDLVKNTKFRDASFRDIDIYDGKCYSLQIGIRWGSQSPYFNFVPECLDKLLRDIYGLNYKEINELFWGRYDEHIINMVLSKKENLAPHLRRLGLDYLNESIDNKFLDKVVNNLIDETKPTSEKHVSIITPFWVSGSERYWVLVAHRCREIGISHPENYILPEIITNHLRDVYSLHSIEEMEYVMDKYYFNIYNKYFRKFFNNTVRVKISESEDLEYNKSYW